MLALTLPGTLESAMEPTGAAGGASGSRNAVNSIIELTQAEVDKTEAIMAIIKGFN